MSAASEQTTRATGSPSQQLSAPSSSSVTFVPRDTAVDDAESSVPAGQPNPVKLDPGDECGDDDDGLEPAAREELARDLEGGSLGDGTLLQDPPDVAEAPPSGLWAASQLQHHRQPETLVTNGGSHFDLSLGKWINETAEAVAGDAGLAAFEGNIGKKLSEDTVVDAMQFMVKIAAEHKKVGHMMDQANLQPSERKHYERLQTAAKAGSFNTQSYLGNQFRVFLEVAPREVGEVQVQEQGRRGRVSS